MTAALALERAVVVQNEYLAIHKDFHAFLGMLLATQAGVGQRADRTVGEAEAGRGRQAKTISIRIASCARNAIMYWADMQNKILHTMQFKFSFHCIYFNTI